MNRLNKSLVTIIMIVTLGLSLIASILYTLALTSEYEASFGYFRTDSLFSIVLYIVIGISVITGLATWIITRKEVAGVKAFNNNLVSNIVRIILGCLILYNAVDQTMTVAIPYNALKYVVYVTYATRILGIISGISLVVSTIVKDKSKTVVCALSFALPLYYASQVLNNYFDQSIAVNSPAKLLFEFAFIAFMLMFTAETGLLLGRGQILPRYYFTIVVTSVLGICIGIAGVISSFTIEGAPYSLIESLIAFVSGICGFVSVVTIENLNLQSVKDPYSKFFEEMNRKAEEREQNNSEENNSETVDYIDSDESL